MTRKTKTYVKPILTKCCKKSPYMPYDNQLCYKKAMAKIAVIMSYDTGFLHNGTAKSVQSTTTKKPSNKRGTVANEKLGSLLHSN